MKNINNNYEVLHDKIWWFAVQVELITKKQICIADAGKSKLKCQSFQLIFILIPFIYLFEDIHYFILECICIAVACHKIPLPQCFVVIDKALKFSA